MLGKSLASPLFTLDSATRFCYPTPDLANATTSAMSFDLNLCSGFPPTVVRGAWISHISMKKFSSPNVLCHSTVQVESKTLSDEDGETWEACKEALASLSFSTEERDKILRKAFGYVHSPYWSEERKKEVPKVEIINEILDYLRSLSLSDDDLYKLLKKFPEVLGCSLEHEMKMNVQILEKDWGIEGKSLRNLLLRNPKVLGYNVDCKGDCMAKCTRCWVRF
ncbi:uncharacterized protein LOC110813283 [Carica papaya]|uniref:uncharacterized protein LOC110813283 n=1 Tax=Carica papaya TaxID=3649 RepID=UPI000B8CAE33|nr:uncharacterized protein LOC110813283 [Carica papaya]XP_021896048.1 uncharacterized protein LOC110813283 [Carica papaya]